MYDDTLHDLRVKYDNTFVGLKLPSEVILPFHVHEMYVADDDIDDEDMDPEDAENIPAEYVTFKGQIWHNSADFTKRWDMTAKIKDLVFDYPRMGVAEVGPGAICGARMANLSSPLKYRKTPGYESLSLLNPGWPEYNALNMEAGTTHLMPEYLYHSWNNQPYRTIEESVELLTQGKRLGCALSPIFSLHVSLEDDNLRVAREGWLIGQYVPEEKQVVLLNEALLVHREELAELGFDVSEKDFVGSPGVAEPDEGEVFLKNPFNLEHDSISDLWDHIHSQPVDINFSLEAM